MMWETQSAFLEQDVSETMTTIPNVVHIAQQIGPVKQMSLVKVNSVQV
jgi:hypothetical protein